MFQSESLRKLVAIGLLALLGVAFFPYLVAGLSATETKLPACCRKQGRHHCMGDMLHQDASSKTSVAGTPERCPYYPAAIGAAVHLDALQDKDRPLVPVLVSGRIDIHVGAYRHLLPSIKIQARGPPAALIL